MIRFCGFLLCMTLESDCVISSWDYRNVYFIGVFPTNRDASRCLVLLQSGLYDENRITSETSTHLTCSPLSEAKSSECALHCDRCNGLFRAFLPVTTQLRGNVIMSNAYPYPEGMLVGGNNWKRREEIIQLFLGFVFVDLQEKIEL